EAGDRSDVIDDVGIRRAERDLPAVAAFAQSPLRCAVSCERTVVLRAAKDGVVVSWMQSDADELSDLKIAVEIGPCAGRVHGRQSPKPAVVSVEQSVGVVINQRMVIDVGSETAGIGVDACPAGATVGGADEIG